PLSLSSHASRRRALHSFPTRRSSDLIGGPHRGRVLATAGIQMAVDAGERISCVVWNHRWRVHEYCASALHGIAVGRVRYVVFRGDRKSTRLNSSHVSISYAVCCWKKK